MKDKKEMTGFDWDEVNSIVKSFTKGIYPINATSSLDKIMMLFDVVLFHEVVSHFRIDGDIFGYHITITTIHGDYIHLYNQKGKREAFLSASIAFIKFYNEHYKILCY